MTGACAFTGEPAGHARMPPGRSELLTEHHSLRFPRPSSRLSRKQMHCLRFGRDMQAPPIFWGVAIKSVVADLYRARNVVCNESQLNNVRHEKTVLVTGTEMVASTPGCPIGA